MADRWPELDAYLRSRGIRVGAATLGQTTGGTHATGSYHYLGLARDHGLYNCDCPAIAAALEPLAKGPNYIIVELIWTPSGGIPAGTYFKAGNRYTPTLKLANGHRDHVHDAIRPGAPHYTKWPGYNAGTPAPPPQPKGFLMALNDAQQQAILNRTENLEKWINEDVLPRTANIEKWLSPDDPAGALRQMIRNVVREELDKP